MDCWKIKLLDFKSQYKLDVSCENIVAEMKKVIAFAMPYIYQLPWFDVFEEISWDVNTHITGKKIFKINWWYWEVCGCKCNTCFEKIDGCKICEDNKFWSIKMTNVAPRKMTQDWEYFLQCPMWNTISYSLPSCFSSWYLAYYRRPEVPNNEEWEIEIPEYLLWPLAILFKYFATNDWTEQKYKLDFIDIINLYREVYAPDWHSSFWFSEQFLQLNNI